MITETETAFLAVIRAFLTEEKASPAEIQGLTEKQWNHLFVLAAQHSLLSAVYYDVVGKTLEFPEASNEASQTGKNAGNAECLQQDISRTALFLSDEKELEHLGVQPLVMKGIVCRVSTRVLAPSGDEDLLISAKDFATVDACFMRKGFVRDKETAMPNGAKDMVMPRKRWATFIRKQGSSMKYIPGCSAQNPLPMVI